MKDRILNSFPILSGFFLILLNSVVVPPSGYSFLTPCLSITCVVFWSINKNYRFNNLEAFLLGIFSDLIVGTPVGSSSLIYIITKEVLYKIHQKITLTNLFFDILKGFLGISIYYFFIYLFILIYFKNMPSMSYFFMGFLLTVFIYPIIYTIFSFIINNKKINNS